MIRKIHEGTDSTEEHMATTEQKEAKISGNDSITSAQVPEMVGETLEMNVDATAGTNTDKIITKTNTSSSEEVDEEALEGEEKIGKDGE
jgi:hypothetical protein